MELALCTGALGIIKGLYDVVCVCRVKRMEFHFQSLSAAEGGVVCKEKCQKKELRAEQHQQGKKMTYFHCRFLTDSPLHVR